MNLRMKNRAYFFKGWATLLIICLISLINCLPKMKNSNQNINRLTYINPSDIAFGDSLAITAYLNDTVFTIDELENKQGPTISFKTVNLFDHDILLPQNSFYVGSIENNQISGVSIIVGQNDRLVLEIQILGKTAYPDNYFNPLKKNDSILSHGDFDIMPHEHYSKLLPGKYWTYLMFSNYNWKKMSIPVWIGSIKSDTLWFKVE